MTIGEAKAAYYGEKPVLYGGSEYERISALIYRKPKGKRPFLELELYDKCGHSVMIAKPDKVSVKMWQNETNIKI